LLLLSPLLLLLLLLSPSLLLSPLSLSPSPPLPLSLPLLMSPLPAQRPRRAGVQAGACMDRRARHWRACACARARACVRAPSTRLIVSCFGWAQSSVQ